MIALIVIAVVLAIIAMLLFIPVRIKIYAEYKNSKPVHEFKIKYGFITLNNKKRKEKKKQEKQQPQKEKIQVMSVIRFIKSNSELVKRLIQDVVGYTTKKLICFEKFELTAVLGTDDAMDTALIYGGASAFLYNTLGVMERIIRMKNIAVDFKPDFTEPQIFIEFESIIKTKIYNVAGLAFITIKRGMPLWKKRGEINNGKSD